MRKVVLGLGISLDGYIARPDGARGFPLHAEGLFHGSVFQNDRRGHTRPQNLTKTLSKWAAFLAPGK